MKRMYSEEELLEVANTENLVDSKGRNRFIEIKGTPEEHEGMQIYYGKCALNGNNLIFEISGVFSQTLPSDITICNFNLPKFIADKITTATANIVDIVMVQFASSTGNYFPSYFKINKDDNTISFVTAIRIDTDEAMDFKMRYNIIIE